MTAVPTTGDDVAVIDLVGVGFGPSNLALAIAVEELAPESSCVFLERGDRLRWHPGMMLDGARMQISFLKDLVTLRNPASPYTFLHYTKAKGRLERFVNLHEFRPTRREYQDYLQWVAGAFADCVRYGTAVTRVSPAGPAEGGPRPWLRVSGRDMDSGEEVSYLARNVVYAAGGTPRFPPTVPRSHPAIVHASAFLPAFPDRFSDTARCYRFAVVGDGQSAAEIVAYLLDRYRAAEVHLFLARHSLRATDDNPFVNEHFLSTSVADFYSYPAAKRAAVQDEMRATNYGVVERELLDHLYRTAYLDEVEGRRRLIVHPSSRLVGATDVDGRLTARFEDGRGPDQFDVDADGVVLATGYERSLDPVIFADVLPFVVDGDGEPVLTAECRVATTQGMKAGLYVQGYGEASFGIGDTLLSLLPFRAQSIAQDVQRNTRPRRRPAAPYPPARYLETDPAVLYEVIERYRFATLVSARAADEPVVTHVPMTLDRERGEHGVLFGHMDAANPHAELLDGRTVLALFHGPNGYISPDVYESRQLPTWNSITVHVRGEARVLAKREVLVERLCGLAAASDRSPDAYRLSPDDPAIERLIGLIVGFEIEIEEILGRFKLSQECERDDRLRAGRALARLAGPTEQHIISAAVRVPVPADAVDRTGWGTGCLP